MRGLLNYKYIIKVYRGAKFFGYIRSIDEVRKSVGISDYSFNAMSFASEKEAVSIVGVLLHITPRNYAFLVKKKFAIFCKFMPESG